MFAAKKLFREPEIFHYLTTIYYFTILLFLQFRDLTYLKVMFVRGTKVSYDPLELKSVSVIILYKDMHNIPAC